MKKTYKHGGTKTPQYYCPQCKHAHTEHSKIGKEHYELKKTKQEVKHMTNQPNFIEVPTVEQANNINLKQYTFVKFSEQRQQYIFKKRANQ